jgi:hypothetical protein
MSPVVITYFYIAASAVLGVKPLPVVMDIPANAPILGQICNGCDVRVARFSEFLVQYGDARFAQSVAAHEACHVYLGHTSEWVVSYGARVAEEQVTVCLEEKFGITPEEDDRMSAEAAEVWAKSK